MRTWGGLFAAFILSATLPQAEGRTFVVKSTKDTIRDKSLRGAILQANHRGGRNVIFLARTHYELTISGIDEENARTGDLDITRGDLTIIGVGGNVRIDAAGLGDRIFHVFPGARLTLVGLVLTGGRAYGGAHGSWAHEEGEPGGAIHNAGTVTLQNCELVENASGAGGTMLGNAPGGSGGPGGAICNIGKLTMRACIVRENASGSAMVSSVGGVGGGIFNLGECSMVDCLVIGNTSGSGGYADTGSGFGGWGGNGGGIHNTGTMKLERCTLADNSTGFGTDGNLPGWSSMFTGGGPGGNGGHGAGIYNAGQLNLKLCTVSGNTTGKGGNGAAGWVGGNGGAGGSGGGIHNAGTLTVTAGTIGFNYTGQGGSAGNSWGLNFGGGDYPGTPGAQGGDGGGIFCGAGAITRLQNTIVAANSSGFGGPGGAGFESGIPDIGQVPEARPVGAAGANGSGPDTAGYFLSGGYNLIGEADGSRGFTNSFNADLVGSTASPIDPLLGPLQDNGGLTPTHALLPDSPAIDKGRRFGAAIDQRGHRRPQDFTAISNAPGGDGTDIGAFELEHLNLR